MDSGPSSNQTFSTTAIRLLAVLGAIVVWLPTPVLTQPPHPDLVVTSVTTPAGVVPVGTSFTVTDTVQNLGFAPAPPSTTRYYLSADQRFDEEDFLLTGTRTVPALDPGASSAESVTVTLHPRCGSDGCKYPALGLYFLVACADDLEAVDETRDAKNCLTSLTQISVTQRTLQPYAYRAIDGTWYTLYPVTGRYTALLAPSSDLDLATLDGIVAAFDGIYDAYRTATGRTPTLFVNYQGLATVAAVSSTCGAGCGYLGATGIELLTSTFNELYEGMRDRGEFDQASAYEFGRNFWFYSAQLANKAPVPDSATTGYAVFMRFVSMDRAGLTGGPFAGHSFADFRAEVEGLVDRYVADPSRNWSNTLGADQGVPNSMNLGAADLFASFLYRLTRRFGDGFVNNVWQEAGRRPAAVTTEDAIDNLVLAASAASDTNLSTLFEQTWRWPLSSGAKQEAAQYPDDNAPTLTLTPSTLDFRVVSAGSRGLTSMTAPEPIELAQIGAGTVTWTAQANQPWIEITPTSGSGPARLRVSIANTPGLLPASGSVSGTIRINPIGAANWPSATVSVTVASPGR